MLQTEFVPHPPRPSNLHVKFLNPNVMAFGDGAWEAVRVRLRYESEVLIEKESESRSLSAM